MNRRYGKPVLLLRPNERSKLLAQCEQEFEEISRSIEHAKRNGDGEQAAELGYRRDSVKRLIDELMSLPR